MFDDVKIVVNWIFSEVSTTAAFLWTSCKWPGICVIGLCLLRKVVDIFKKIL